MNKRFESLLPALDDVRAFVELSHEDRNYLMINAFTPPYLAKATKDREEHKKIANQQLQAALWYARLVKMELLDGWDMSRRDPIFFACVTEPMPEHTPEQLEQINELTEKYKKPAKKAAKEGRHKEADRLMKIFDKKMDWLRKDMQIFV